MVDANHLHLCLQFDAADAKKAVKVMNGEELAGAKLKVAISSSDRAIANGDSDVCHSCGMHGHISRFCPADKKDVCHKCGFTGHWAKECPVRSGETYISHHHQGLQFRANE